MFVYTVEIKAYAVFDPERVAWGLKTTVAYGHGQSRRWVIICGNWGMR